MVPNIVGSREGCELYIVTDGVMVGILLDEGDQWALLVPSERCSIEDKSIEYCGWALGTLPEDGNIMPKHVEATINN
jgi:hypothetical protein